MNTSARETRHLTEPAAVKGRTTHDLGFRRESNPLLAYCSLLNPASVSVSAGNPFICCRTRRPRGHCADGSVRRAATNERDMPLCGATSLFIHPVIQRNLFSSIGKHWFEDMFFRSAHIRARREPQCPTKASVPDESKLEPVQLAPRTAPRTASRIRKLI